MSREHALPATGAGLGLRRDFLPDLLQHGIPAAIDFFEIAPENWAGIGGQSARALRQLSEQVPFVCHGLSLSLGGSAPLDTAFLAQIKRFMRAHGITRYTEHLAWCADAQHLYNLLPIPFTGDAVRWTAQRIRQAQAELGHRIAIENASTYMIPPGAEMDEASFICAILDEADCLLHLDVNNVYVNSRNHGFDPQHFIDRLPPTRIDYLHVAGHFCEADGLLVDTHGAPVIDPVWQLLAHTYQHIGATPPTCLERDFNLPPLADLCAEVQHIRRLQHAATAQTVSMVP